MPGCLILAAGSHRRFGSAKLLHPLADGRPLIQHTLDHLQASGLPLALIHRPDDSALLAAVSGYNLLLVPCNEHEGGMGHSIAAGINATRHWGGWLLCLADMPQILGSTYRQIADALQHHAIVIPEYNTRFGNPRGFQARFAEALAALTGDQGPRDLLVQHRRNLLLAVTDPGILVDVDYPADAQQIAATTQTQNKHLPAEPTITGQDSNMTDTTQKNPDADEQAQTTAVTDTSASASCCAAGQQRTCQGPSNDTATAAAPLTQAQNPRPSKPPQNNPPNRPGRHHRGGERNRSQPQSWSLRKNRLPNQKPAPKQQKLPYRPPRWPAPSN
ncbi:MAG: nucleotidyltransferase family protein [Gammaproteobacteria bacterium]